MPCLFRYCFADASLQSTKQASKQAELSFTVRTLRWYLLPGYSPECAVQR